MKQTVLIHYEPSTSVRKNPGLKSIIYHLHSLCVSVPAISLRICFKLLSICLDNDLSSGSYFNLLLPCMSAFYFSVGF